MEALPKGNFKRYLGNPFTSMFFLFGIIVALAPVLKAYNHHSVQFNDYLCIESLAVSLIIFSGLEQNYFLVSPEYVVVKNRIFIWKTTIIGMKEITGASIELGYRKRTVVIVTDLGERTFNVGVWNDRLDELAVTINGYIEN